MTAGSNRWGGIRIYTTNTRCPTGLSSGSYLILHLGYINDLPDEVRSQVRLFADDTALYLTMESENESSTLRNDLGVVWETRWDMEFNPSKCQAVHVSCPKRPVKRDYVLHGQVLESASCAKYFGVNISGSLTWNSHFDRTASTAKRTLGFVQRNIKTKISRMGWGWGLGWGWRLGWGWGWEWDGMGWDDKKIDR